MRRIFQNSIALVVVVIVMFLIIPLHEGLLDILIITNISISIVILMVTMTISEALEFSIFPSLLLITTLFRLGLNVSTTRAILSYDGTGEVGTAVIRTFGQLITQGNIVLGIIIFFIIVLVQFIVITKGAERVAEVAARFTLDAMPGKQMAIDADLSSGLINEQQARDRRAKIQKEADFYGAMDGATKIVKGDATMSLIITAINLIGGIIIGSLNGVGDLGAVAQTYSIATIGDGLVSQLPSIMISTATGMIVTRSVSDGSLNTDVINQFARQPRAILTAGVVLVILGLIPGTPTLPLLIVGVGLAVLGYMMSGRLERQTAEAMAQPEEPPEADIAATPSETDYYKDINNVYSLLTVDPIEMEFGYSLIPLVDEGSGGKMINRIVIFRRQYAQEMGFVVPSVRLRDSSSLNTNQYVIKVKGEEVERGEILVDHYLALEPDEPVGEIDGIETIEPAYGIPSKWILPENKEMAEIYGYTVIDPLSVMVTHLSETIRRHAFELLNREEVVKLADSLKQRAGALVEEVVPGLVPYGTLQKILTSLLKEGIPIKDMETIMETISDAAASGLDLTTIIENIRTALKRTITSKFCRDGQMRVLTLDAELEKMMVSSLTKGEQGYYMALPPDVMQSVVMQIGNAAKKFHELSQDPIILTSQVIRVYVYRMLEQFYPSIYVLSFNEISNNVQIQAVGNITK